jgi:hypothetical protein
MIITIESTGTYIDDDWVTTEVVAEDDENQKVSITRDIDGTYCVESDLHGDDKPVFTGGIKSPLKDLWVEMGRMLGVLSS